MNAGSSTSPIRAWREAASRRTRALAVLALLGLGLAVGAPAWTPAHAGSRLDREEREQLRHELRRQAREERYPGWPAQDRGRRMPREDGWQSGRDRGGLPDPGRGDGRGEWRGDWRGPGGAGDEWRGPGRGRHWEGDRFGREERYRMPPEERERLREMLREHRRGRRD